MEHHDYLRIKRVRLEDEGIFTCVVRNDFGTTTKHYQLIISGADLAPQFSMPEWKDAAISRNGGSLQCLALLLLLLLLN